MFSKTFGYALRAVVFLQTQAEQGKNIGLQEMSATLEIPHHFLGKLMQDLVRHGIVDSTKGPDGGFMANERTDSVLLTDILNITDGSLVFEHCALNMKQCNSIRPCPLHNDFAVCRNGMLKVMSTTTVGMLAKNVDAGLAFLVR